ncbi:hypothetical protein P8918_12930 [Bacillus spizizenii]|nr:hypothetical protein [Bacillus spizizenii]MCY8890474.1 hypothetical protein [Bacillus spizizenii]MEC0841929.1 hypothetical protein [Bacillus spizizenii]
MPNYCNYSMKVTGNPEAIREFIEVIQREDRKSGRYLCRIFEAEVLNEETIPEGFVEIAGDCAWSVYSCMMEGPNTYSKDDFAEFNKNKQEIESLKKSNNLAMKINYAFEQEKIESEMLPSSLIRESRLLNLTIEVFSNEYGIGFQEHIVIENGDIVVDDCKDAQEYDTTEFETVEKFNKEYDLNISTEEFESNEYIIIGGFGDWEFDKYREEKK